MKFNCNFHVHYIFILQYPFFNFKLLKFKLSANIVLFLNVNIILYLYTKNLNIQEIQLN